MIVKTEFGFKCLEIGKYKIYTGKIRFKDIVYTDPDSRIQIRKFGKYTTISYETLSIDAHEHLSQKLGKLCKTVAQSKLDKKYGWIAL
jgi:hypothetical protein